MDRYAVLGQPIAHSLSPHIHAAFAAQTGASLHYEAIETAPAALADTLKRLLEAGYRGLNLTLPLKVEALALCSALSARAEAAGSANTLVRTEGGWQGDNTDGEGLVRDLETHLGFPLAGRRILVLGAGGAARGILGPLLEAKPAELVLAGRTPWKAEEVVLRFKDRGPLRPCTFLALKGDRFDLVINATSAGHQGTALRLPPDLFAEGALAYDLNYGPAASAFLEWAGQEKAARRSDGLGMLVEQAAGAFSLWRGSRPQTATVLEGLRASA